MSDSRPPCQCVLCHDYGDRDRMDNFLLRTIVHITQYGWSVVLVPGENDGPGWAYTLGLWHSHRVPELAMFGRDVYETEEILNGLGRAAAAGWRPADGDRRDDVVRGQAAAFRAADPRWYRALFRGVVDFYRVPPLPVMQVVWPDEDDLFPWQPGTELEFRHSQPWLWLHPRRHPAGRWTRHL
ncbi:DUF4262 domain-containing protein [Actinomadura parmotrematis]|uniref:DUF4262 domain-containing protein n=1 Tax=Actinomadura parmotrematis TaxID=2864039 RepID=A0ABS7FPR9_9ACTN|nr:DUF4262 domain-containing protein [Actinomadura parmotrematis]MBW8482399.1 DUF4262 domain-containing protein [Actinomadura parmotrematis]